MSRARIVIVVMALAAGAVAPARADAPCTEPTAAGGEWTTYGKDLEGTRHQTDEDLITVANAGLLEPAWVFNTVGAGADGGFIASIAVAGGCVFFSDAGEFGRGYVYALDATDGGLVWKVRDLEDEEPRNAFWASRGGVAVHDGRVHVNVTSASGPVPNSARGVAFDASTGDVAWTSDAIEFGHTTNAGDAGPAIWGGHHLVWTTGPDGDPKARPGFALVDAETGDIVRARTSIPTEDLARGYAGGGVWSTPTVADGFAFAATANPDSHITEHDYDNAILKLDMRPESATFGEIVGAYKGDWDTVTYDGSTYNNPLCRTLPTGTFFNPSCATLDIDFGSPATIARASDGRTLVGNIQKSGTFHVLDAETMEPVWKKRLFVWTAFQGNQGAAATDGKNFYVPANPGVLWALDVITGEVRWSAPLPGEFWTHHPVSLANGVIYVTTNTGELLGYNAETGGLVLDKNLVADSGHVCGDPASAGPYGLAWSSSVAIADNTVFATCDNGPDGGFIVAYRLPETFPPL